MTGGGGSSLIVFHRVLIISGILFCLGFAIWTWASGEFTIAVVFVVLAVALSFYLARLTRFLGYRDS